MNTAYLLLLISIRARPPCLIGAAILTESSPTFGDAVYTVCILEKTGVDYDAAHEAVLRAIIADPRLFWVADLLGPQTKTDIVELIANG